MKIFFIIAILFFTFFKAEANLAYVTNEKDNTVSVIDIKKKKLLKPLRLGKDQEA